MSEGVPDTVDQPLAGQRRTLDDPEAKNQARGSAVLARGATIGRYVVLRRIGAGGMGVVYSAYDPELDRRVALKLLQPDSSSRDTIGRTRLVREAQALAKLSHPNVVAVHDVGTADKAVYVAMEYVEGQTITRWLEQTRSWKEIVALLTVAGDGLAAAHAKGIIHRDFKPDNVMVGDDGRVRVMDFGLARAEQDDGDAADPEGAPTGRNTALTTDLTRVGSMMGTPAYMAPEQFASGETDARTDQFNFCAALWEALYKMRPFHGDNVPGLARSVTQGELVDPPARSKVPPWVRRIVARGLRPDPDDRWPSMGELLQALRADPTRRRRRWGLVGLVLAGVVALPVGRQAWLASDEASCSAAGTEIDGVWNAVARQRLHDDLVASGASYADTTFERTVPQLDRFAHDWNEVRVEVCRRTEIHEVWSPPVRDLALGCLQERRLALEGLLAAMSAATVTVARRAVEASGKLAGPRRCLDESSLARRPQPPKDDASIERLDRVVAALASANALDRTAQYERSLEVSQGAQTEASALGWPPLLAQAHQSVGVALESLGRYAEAETELRTAFRHAFESGEDERATTTAATLAYVVGYKLGRHEDGLLWGELGESLVGRLGDAEGQRSAMVLANIATLHRVQGNFDKALELHERVLELETSYYGRDSPSVAATLNNLANALRLAGKPQEARNKYDQAVEIGRRVYGPDHPTVAQSISNLASTHHALHDYDEAKRLFAMALEIQEPALGKLHPDLAATLSNLGMTQSATGAHHEAIVSYEQALAIQEHTFGLDHLEVAITVNNMGSVYDKLGSPDEARPRYERALAIWLTSLGADHPNVATTELNLCELDVKLGEHERARPRCEHALASLEVALGPGHPYVAMAAHNLGRIAEAQGRGDRARDLFARALEARADALEPGDGDLAESRFAVARTIVDREPKRARALAEQARETWQAKPDAAASLAEVEAWLVAQPTP